MDDVMVRGVRKLVGYNRRVFERFEASARRHGWSEAVVNREIGHRSIKDTLVHILNVQEAWLVAIGQRRWEIFEEPGRRPDAIRSWDDLRAYRTRVWGGIDDFLGTLRKGTLERRVKAPWMPGIYTAYDGVLQATIERAHHLGEIIGVYWQQDWTPPTMTWIENADPRLPRGGRDGSAVRPSPRTEAK